ncbi:MAG TPA: TonB-dependent receptor [Xanthomonadaceae bacterium]|nr:TonB-dependent receptor [Xanthomonadaceae bacterium]
MTLKRNLLSAALASATIMLAAQAHAQEAAQQAAQVEAAQSGADEDEDDDATELERVVVTGIRAAIEESIDTKRESTSIVEAISAEDLGKLPDTSIADSIARLPGLTAQRFGGRPQEINIRGFAGDFSTTTLNGREQVSLGNNRGVEFDQYPSELIHQVVVYKTPDASLVGQGLSGTVDLRTVRPLEFGEQAVALNLRGDMNRIDDEKEYGNRFSLSYIDQFADDTIGLALGYARMDTPGQGYKFESWGYPGGAIGGGQLYDFENDNVREGLMGVLEYKPNDFYRTTLDLFYSQFERDESKRGMEFGFEWGASGPPVSRVDNANGIAVEATFEGVRPIVRNDFNSTHDDLFSIGWNNEFKFNADWTMRVDAGHSSAKRNERILETYATLHPDAPGDTVVARFNPDGYFDFDFGLDYGDPANLVLMDPGGWGGDRAQAGYLKDFEVEDTLSSLRLDFERSFVRGPIVGVDFGVNVTDRNKSRFSSENTLCTTAGCTDNTPVAIPTAFVGGSTEFGFGGLPSLITLDPLGMVDGFYILLPKNHPDISNKNWEIDETVTTAYVQANVDTRWGSVPVRGNFGVQVVQADQSSTGVATFEGVALDEPSKRGATHTDVLPSLNLAFELPADQVLRLGVARQMARPRMDDLRANAGYGINRTSTCGSTPPPCWTGGGGNPELEPWLANAYDLSYEKYFGDGAGYFSVAYFHKDLKSYIYNQSLPFDFSQLPLPDSVDPADVPADPIGMFSQPANGEGGAIWGHEIALSIPLGILWQGLEGFGVVANYSDTNSTIQPLGPGTTEPLPGLSKYVSNITAYYERHGFSVRASQRHRSDFLGEIQGFGGDRTKRVFQGETVTDLQVGYSFPEGGALDGLSLLLQVNNLENEPFRSTYGSDDQPRDYYEYGRTYLFGVNYKF